MNLHTAIEKELSRAYIAGMIGANLFEDEAIKRIINLIKNNKRFKIKKKGK